MKVRFSICLVAGVLWSGLCAAENSDDPLFGAFKDIPVQVQEFHLWWATPFQGEPGERGWSKWLWGGDVEVDRAVGPAWVRRLSSAAQPLIGAYHSSDPEVMRWQLRCAKAAGIDALQIQLYPHIATGGYYTREKAFAQLLEIAAEEKMPIFAHDELMFVPGEAQKPENMRKRMSALLNKFGSSPGYYKIDGKPVFAFQYWNRFISIPVLGETLRNISSDVKGGVHFQVSGGTNPELTALPEVGSVIATGNAHGHLRNFEDRTAEVDWEKLDKELDHVSKYAAQTGRKRFGLLGYPGFEETAKGSGEGRWLRRGDGLSYLAEVLGRYRSIKPDMLILSSWNDWNENTAFEPSLNVDGRKDDPYEGLRFIAKLKGKEFVPPPLPSSEHVDPWGSATLGGKDHTPPYATQAWMAPLVEELRMGFVDETSPIAKASIARTAAAEISWSATEIQARGLKVVKKSPELETGLDWPGIAVGKDGNSLNLEMTEADTWKSDEPVWLAVVYLDRAVGRFVLNYPNALPENRDPTDGWVYPFTQPIHLTGTGHWKVRVRRLHGFDPAKAGNWLNLSFFQKNGEQWSTLPPVADGALPVIAAVQLFKASDFDSKNLYLAGKNSDGSASTFRMNGVSWNPKSPLAALIVAEDEKGNAAFPIPVVPGFLKTPQHQVYPIDP